MYKNIAFIIRDAYNVMRKTDSGETLSGFLFSFDQEIN